MKFKVLITADVDQSGIELLKSNGCTVINEEGQKIENVAGHIGDCDGVITRTQHIDEAVFLNGKSLKVVGKHGVGVDCIDVNAATRHGVQVVNAPESNNDSVVEHTLAFILASMKKTLRCHQAVVNGNFTARDMIEVFQLKGKTLGIVGYGRVGRKVAFRAQYAFDVHVLIYDPFLNQSLLPFGVEKSDSLNHLLEHSDLVTLHLPLTPQTHHFIGKDEFKRMKPSAYLVNMARGPVVDEAALVQALKSRSISGAALDVFENEPPSSDNDLFTLDNVILSPHNAALTKEAKEQMSLHAAQGVVDVLEGRNPAWPVNFFS